METRHHVGVDGVVDRVGVDLTRVQRDRGEADERTAGREGRRDVPDERQRRAGAARQIDAGPLELASPEIGVGSFLNVGTGQEMTILELAQSIAKVIGWKGTFTLDTSKPDGIPRKVMDVSRLRILGWIAPTDFETGMKQAYDWYVANVAGLRSVDCKNFDGPIVA